MQSATPLRSDITDMHYAQLFFVVGHVAIKMLTYVEHLDSDLKKSGTHAGTENFQAGNKGKKQQDGNDDSKQAEDELDQIGGGKEAEIEQYSQMLHRITEDTLI